MTIKFLIGFTLGFIHGLLTAYIVLVLRRTEKTSSPTVYNDVRDKLSDDLF